ncbi:MAG: O-methyltransferase [Candidatus Levybacteria bacterium]|nr:O-methyltransferase [Candidatus Levybacteria bacterium]
MLKINNGKDTLNFILNRYNARGQKNPIELHCSRLISFPRLFKELGFAAGAEIGVARGYFARRLCQRVPNLKMYAVDAWAPWNKATSGDAQRLEGLYRGAKERLGPYNCEIIRDWSMKAISQFANESLDFVYIDAGHDYKSAIDDIRGWSKKVKKGGIVAGHDYLEPEAFTFGNFNHDNYDVKKAVDDFVKENNIFPLFVFTKDIPSNKPGDEKLGIAPSWFYVKS